MGVVSVCAYAYAMSYCLWNLMLVGEKTMSQVEHRRCCLHRRGLAVDGRYYCELRILLRS